VKNAIETIESPFDNKTIIESLPNRTTKPRKGKRTDLKPMSKRRRNKIKLDDDPEIDSLLKIYGDNMTVHK
jgi:hypothetical protein